MTSETTRLIPKNFTRSVSAESSIGTTSYQRLKCVGFVWKKYVSTCTLVVLLIFPMILYRGEYFSFLQSTSYSPLSGIIACSIPSGGAPVAGGIVFLPILTMMGIEPHDSVAFTAATQMIGCGIFAPLGWMYKDPDVIMFKSFLLPFFPVALVGLILGLLCVPLQKSDNVLWAFTLFIIFLAYYTGRALIKNELNGAKSIATCNPSIEVPKDINVEDGIINREKECTESGLSSSRCIRDITYTQKELVIYSVFIFLGGIMTSWIGIGVEKITFLLLTAIHNVDVIAAGLSSIVMTGWLSIVAFLFHAACAPPEDGPGPHWVCAPIINGGLNPDGHVSGNVPFKLWLSVIPGILVGSMVGPKLNEMIGARNIMILFVIFLIFDAGYNIYNLVF